MQKEQRIAVYGISPATQEFLEQKGDKYHIVGLLDGYCQEGEIYGYSIISLEEAFRKEIEAIIIVARPSSRRIVVNRIRKVCQEQGICLYDTEGNDLLEAVRQELLEAMVSTISKKQLMEQIERAEVVSFDIFDTLITRRVLYPADVFDLMEQRLIEKYGQGFDFQRNRRLAESNISQDAAPNIYEIYEELKKYIDLPDAEWKEIRQLEWDLERQVILPREEVCELFRYAKSLHKKVYLVSDMYYTAKQLAELLEPYGIVGFEKLLVSCDYNTGKGQQLFQYLKEDAKAQVYLHIGDNPAADVEGATRNGIKGIQIQKGLDMFEAMPWATELMRYDGLSERWKLGMFIARMFNSPFAFERKRLSIHKPVDLGYLFLAPILTDFVLWIYRSIKKMRGANVLFSARDGFLLKGMFDRLLQEEPEPDQSLRAIYFLTSRISALGAGLYNAEDILKVAGKDFNGTLQQLLKTRFSLKEEEIAYIGGDSDGEGVLKYKEIILNRAMENRGGYGKYISSLELVDKETVFFDFVSSGTCQAALEKMMDCKMQGYYFIRVADDSPEKKALSITSFYDGDNDGKGIYEDYFILENILTSPMPSLQCFDAEGKPKYLDETRSKEQIEFVAQVQEGILEYFQQYLEVMQREDGEECRECSAKLFELLHKVSIDNEVFHSMVWDDSFYGRTVPMKELM